MNISHCARGLHFSAFSLHASLGMEHYYIGYVSLIFMIIPHWVSDGTSVTAKILVMQSINYTNTLSTK